MRFNTVKRINLGTAPPIKLSTAGFDDERLDTSFLTLPVSWKGTIVQYAGRLHRLNDSKKEVIIYDYVDYQEGLLLKMFERRRRGYKAIGYILHEESMIDSKSPKA